jgi:hypothetical protein
LSNPTLSNKPFYTADCAIEGIGVDPHPAHRGKVDAWAVGRVVLVSGNVELHFNWTAQGGDSVQTAYDFEIDIDEEDPDFQLEGMDTLSADDRQKTIKYILNSSPWRAEILECLPKTPQELANLR